MKHIECIILAAALTLIPAVALANAGVPMLFITLPAMVVALVPIILAEMVIWRMTLDSTWGQAGLVSAVANAASTFIGVPIAWGAFLERQRHQLGRQEVPLLRRGTSCRRPCGSSTY